MRCVYRKLYRMCGEERTCMHTYFFLFGFDLFMAVKKCFAIGSNFEHQTKIYAKRSHTHIHTLTHIHMRTNSYRKINSKSLVLCGPQIIRFGTQTKRNTHTHLPKTLSQKVNAILDTKRKHLIEE